jgi:hypothetical protein
MICRAPAPTILTVIPSCRAAPVTGARHPYRQPTTLSSYRRHHLLDTSRPCKYSPILRRSSPPPPPSDSFPPPTRGSVSSLLSRLLIRLTAVDHTSTATLLPQVTCTREFARRIRRSRHSSIAIAEIYYAPRFPFPSINVLLPPSLLPPYPTPYPAPLSDKKRKDSTPYEIHKHSRKDLVRLQLFFRHAT